MSTDTGWAQGCNNRGGYPTEQAELIAELDAENARLHGELIDVQCELATARSQLRQMEAECGRSRQIEQRVQERLQKNDAMVKALGGESHLSEEGHATRRALQWVLRP